MSKLASLGTLKGTGVLAASGVIAGLGIMIIPGLLGDQTECPELFLETPLVVSWPDACGTGRPPYDPQDDLSGIWDIEAPGNPHVDALTVALDRGHPGVGWRENDAPYVAQARSIEKAKGSTKYDVTSMSISITEDGTVHGRYGQYAYCNCVHMEFQVKPTTDNNIMTGTWAYEDKSGSTTWRRRPPAQVRSVYYRNKTADPGQGFIRDKAAFGDRPLLVERDHPVTCGHGLLRGNCDAIWLTVEGDGFAGGHDVWVDPASYLDIDFAGWHCDNGSRFNSEWYMCGSSRIPGDGVAGLSLRLTMWDGIKPGIKTLWVNGKPVELKVIIHNYPTEEEVKNPDDLDVVDFEHAEGAAGDITI